VCIVGNVELLATVFLVYFSIAFKSFSFFLSVLFIVFFVEKREKWLAKEAGRHCEVMAASLLRHEGWLHLLLHVRRGLFMWKAAAWFNLFTWKSRHWDTIQSCWCWKIPVWNSDRFVSAVALLSAEHLFLLQSYILA